LYKALSGLLVKRLSGWGYVLIGSLYVTDVRCTYNINKRMKNLIKITLLLSRFTQELKTQVCSKWAYPFCKTITSIVVKLSLMFYSKQSSSKNSQHMHQKITKVGLSSTILGSRQMKSFGCHNITGRLYNTGAETTEVTVPFSGRTRTDLQIFYSYLLSKGIKFRRGIANVPEGKTGSGEELVS